jgi:hypothetical protein
MKSAIKNEKKTHDDSLFGLLSPYKANNTFVKVLKSEKDNTIALFFTHNPKTWYALKGDRFKDFREMRRLEIKIDVLILKYIQPYHLVAVLGPTMGIKIPIDKLRIINRLEQEGFHFIETQMKYKQRILLGLRKILNLSPQKKFEILEKSFADIKD